MNPVWKKSPLQRIHGFSPRLHTTSSREDKPLSDDENVRTAPITSPKKYSDTLAIEELSEREGLAVIKDGH